MLDLSWQSSICLTWRVCRRLFDGC